MTKQVLVMLTRYPDGKGGTFKPRKGKLIAQGAHASMKVFLDRKQPLDDGPLTIGLTAPMARWISGTFTKIVVGCDSSAELVALHTEARAAGICTAIVEDSGTTETHGLPVITAVAIGPDTAERIDPITGHLKLL